MKRLNPSNIDPDLPAKVKIIADPYRYHGKGSVHHPTDGIWPRKRAERMLKANIGKQFDKVFAEFCKQVPVYQQHIFLEEFNRGVAYANANYSWMSYYFVDSAGNIQFKKSSWKKNRTVYFRSDDFATERLHKITGKKYSNIPWWKCKNVNEDDYAEFIVSGYELKFKSASDPEYIRLRSDQNKRFAAIRRAKKKIAEQAAYDFLSRKEKQALEDKAKDKIKIESKGFDYKTSFRGENQTNPDAIKEDQGFVDK
jgi:hypothetical protein